MKKRNAQICAVLLAAATIFAGTFAAHAEDLNLDRTVALTIQPGPDGMEDLANADVTVDLYKVADAVESTDGTSSYTFAVDKGVTLSKEIATYDNLAALSNEDWRTLAQDAAKSVLLDADGGVLEAPALAVETNPKELTAGLYLVIAHQTGAPLSAYVHSDGTTVTTTANSSSYIYSWLPELVALPSTVDEISEGVEVNTAGGDWKYDITAVLKPSQRTASGDLHIHKTLSNYNVGSPVTFVFSITATLEEKVVFEDVASLTFSQAGTQTYTIVGKIPVGAQVTVTEIYSGAGYAISGASEATVTMSEQEDGSVSAEVSFTNDYNGENKVGYGILNKFTYGEDGWQLTKQ